MLLVNDIIEAINKIDPDSSALGSDVKDNEDSKMHLMNLLFIDCVV